MENLDLPFPKVKDGKMPHFCPSRDFILDLGGRGVFILSKIVVMAEHDTKSECLE